MNVKDSLYKVNQNIGCAQAHLDEAKKVQTKLQRYAAEKKGCLVKPDKLSDVIEEVESARNYTNDDRSYKFYTYILKALKAVREA